MFYYPPFNPIAQVESAYLNAQMVKMIHTLAHIGQYVL
nr:MAG TPA: hypothetical protein [Caudoviricetes sp.]